MADRSLVLRITGHVLNFISMALLIVGLAHSGPVYELALTAGLALWFIARHFYDAAEEIDHG